MGEGFVQSVEKPKSKPYAFPEEILPQECLQLKVLPECSIYQPAPQSS